MAQLEHIEAIEKRLWSAADTLRANSNLASNQYFLPVMGLVFLRHAYSRYLAVHDEVVASLPKRGGVTRPVTKADFSDKGALFLRPEARFDYLASLPDGANRAQAIVAAMESIEADYETLRGVLPKNDYHSIDNDVLGKLLVKLDPEELKHMSGDVFGRIYEYFLTQFAGQGAHDGGEFFTPVSLVSFIANVLEPERGIVLDPACGSGGMFVQSARVVERRSGRPSDTLTFYGMEKNDVTIRLAKMNLAVHGLEGDIRQAITYYSDPHELVGKCDFVMANPPFNVDDIDAARVKADPRLPFGLPGENKEGRVPNGNYVWISYFYSYLNKTGRAGFVMAAGAESAGRDEALVRRKLVETGDVEAMVSIRSNFFYTRTVPCVLWFIDRGKTGQPSPSGRGVGGEGNVATPDRRRHVLMIDARGVFRKVTRKICDFSPEQERNLVAIVWLYRGETERFRALLADYRAQSAAVDLSPVAAFWKGMDAKREDTVEAIESAARARITALDAEAARSADAKGRRESAKAAKAVEEASAAAVEALKRREYFLDAARWLEERFPDGVYRDVEGLVKAVSLEEIAANDWSLTPGRYVGVAETDDGDEDFAGKFAALHEELRALDAEAATLARKIDANFKELMGA